MLHICKMGVAFLYYNTKDIWSLSLGPGTELLKPWEFPLAQVTGASCSNEVTLGRPWIVSRPSQKDQDLIRSLELLVPPPSSGEGKRAGGELVSIMPM